MHDTAGTRTKKTTPPDTTKEIEGQGKNVEKGAKPESQKDLQQDLDVEGLDTQGADSLCGMKRTTDPLKGQQKK